MGSFVPNTKEEREQMLREAGYKSFDDMFSVIPEEVRLKKPLDLPSGLSEMEALKVMEDLAAENKVYREIFRGAGPGCVSGKCPEKIACGKPRQKDEWDA